MNTEKLANRWVVLTALFAANLCVGSAYAWSVFQKPLIDMFKWSTSDTSLAFSISLFVVPLAMIVAGAIAEKGPRYIISTGGVIFSCGIITAGYVFSVGSLYATYGLLGGIGIGFVYGTSINSSVKWFPDKRGMAAGLVASGFAFGAMLVAPIATALVQNYGVLDAFKILGVSYLLVTTIASRFVSAPPAGYCPVGWIPPAQTASTVTGVDKTWREMLKEPLFYMTWIMYTIGCVSGLMIIGHAATIGQEIIKLSAATAAVAVSTMSLANAGGRIFWGAVSDRLGQYMTLIIMFIISALSMLAMNGVSSFPVFVITISVIAACFGGFFAIFPSVTADMFGGKNLGMNYGILFTSYGIAAFIGPRLAARVKELNAGDYTVAFITAAAMCALAVALTFYVKMKQQKNSVPFKTEENTMAKSVDN